MSNALALSLLAVPSILWSAQDTGVTKLQCEGTYSNYSSPDVRDIPTKSIYLEISGDRIKVLGAMGFDSTYAVITRREDGLGFQLESNESYGGFLNRFSGELSLIEKGEAKADGDFKARQVIIAVCTNARSLF